MFNFDRQVRFSSFDVLHIFDITTRLKTFQNAKRAHATQPYWRQSWT